MSQILKKSKQEISHICDALIEHIHGGNVDDDTWYFYNRCLNAIDQKRSNLFQILDIPKKVELRREDGGGYAITLDYEDDMSFGSIGQFYCHNGAWGVEWKMVDGKIFVDDDRDCVNHLNGRQLFKVN